MRVALIGPVYPFRGGIAHHTTMLARALASTERVLVISFRRQYPRLLYPGRSDRDPSGEPLTVPAEYLLDAVNPLTWMRVARRIEQYSAEVVVIQWWTTFWAPAFAALARASVNRGLPLLYLIHNVLPHETRFYDPWLARLALREGTSFIVQSETEGKRLQSLLPNSTIHTFEHPAYRMFTHQMVEAEDARRHLGLPGEGVPIVLAFGIVRPYKGLRYLLEAIRVLRDRREHVFLIVAGEFWEPKTFYLELAERLGISSQVRFDDRYIPNEEVALLFSAADAFVAPYVGGTQSGAVRLALGFGTPVVTTRPEDLPSSLPQSMGVLVKPRDSGALAEGIQRVLSTTRPSEDVPRTTPEEGIGEWGGLSKILRLYVKSHVRVSDSRSETLGERSQ